MYRLGVHTVSLGMHGLVLLGLYYALGGMLTSPPTTSAGAGDRAVEVVSRPSSTQARSVATKPPVEPAPVAPAEPTPQHPFRQVPMRVVDRPQPGAPPVAMHRPPATMVPPIHNPAPKLTEAMRQLAARLARPAEVAAEPPEDATGDEAPPAPDSKPAGERQDDDGGGQGARQLTFPQPRYPGRCITRDHQGTILFEVDIDPAGGVIAVRMVESTLPCDRLRREARRALDRATFSAAREDGRPVAGSKQVQYTFKLTE